MLQISLCKQHKKNLNHQNLCDNLKVAFQNLLLLQQTKAKSLPTIADQGSTMISIRSVPIQTKLKNLPSTIKEFMDSCTISSGEVAELFSKDPDIFSEVLSRPLTLLYGIQKLNLTNASSLTIHVIGATNEEFRCAGYWEILLHWLPKLKEIKVAFVGPEINGPFQLAITACESCNFVSKKPALVSSRRSHYDEYFESKFYSKPDIVVGYNLDLHESELGLSECTWKETILSLKKVEAPLILTAGTEDRATKDHERFCNLFEKSVSRNCCEINPFASLIPERDFETEELKYANKYIVIYERLYEEKLPVGSDVCEVKRNSVAEESKESKKESLGLEDSKKQLEDAKVKEEEKEIGASGLAALEEKLAAAEIEEGKTSDEVFQVPIKEEKAEVLLEEKSDAQEVRESTKETKKSEESEKKDKDRFENVESVAKSESRPNLRIPENQRPLHEDLLQENLMLRKENQLLRENQQLKEENGELKDENQKLKQENERLRIENDVIKDLRSQVEESIRAAMSGIHGCIK